MGRGAFNRVMFSFPEPPDFLERLPPNTTLAGPSCVPLASFFFLLHLACQGSVHGFFFLLPPNTLEGTPFFFFFPGL